MLATVLHRTHGYTGEMILGDGTALEFVNGQAGPTTITFADAQSLTVMGFAVVTTDTPSTGYDLFTDQLMAPVVASSASNTSAALKAAFGLVTIIPPSGDATGATDTAAWQAAIAAHIGTGHILSPVAGADYYISAPLAITPTNTGTGNVPQQAPSIFCMGGPGRIGDETEGGGTRFIATATFPVGSFLIDYRQSGSVYGTNGVRVGGLTLECNGRAAGFRAQGARQYHVSDMSIIQPAAPVSPGDGATGGFSITMKGGGGNDGGAYSTFNNIVVDRAGLDSFAEVNTRDLNTYLNCQSLGPARNNYYSLASDATYFGCGYEQGVTAVWLDSSSTAKFFGLRSYAGAAIGLTGNAVVITAGIGSTGTQYSGPKFYGCDLGNAPAGGTGEQAGAVVNIKEFAASLTQTAMFHGCLFFAHANTTDWFYAEAGIGGAVQVADCEFKGTVATSLWNDQSGILEFARCTGLTVPTAGEVDSSAGALTLTGTAQDVPGATATLFTPKGKLLVTAVFDFGVAITNEILGGLLNVDGTARTRTAFTSGSLQRQAVGQAWMVPLAAGSHTIKLQAQRVTGSNAGHVVNGIHTGFTYQFVSDVS